MTIRSPTVMLLALFFLVIMFLEILAIELGWAFHHDNGGNLLQMMEQVSNVKVIRGSPDDHHERHTRSLLIGLNDAMLQVLKNIKDHPVAFKPSGEPPYTFIIWKGVDIAHKSYGYYPDNGILCSAEGWYRVDEPFRVWFLEQIQEGKLNIPQPSSTGRRFQTEDRPYFGSQPTDEKRKAVK